MSVFNFLEIILLKLEKKTIKKLFNNNNSIAIYHHCIFDKYLFICLWYSVENWKKLWVYRATLKVDTLFEKTYVFVTDVDL